MDKKKIIKEYKEKINLLKKYNKFYYEKSKPIVSDKDYDDLKQNILQIEKNTNLLIQKIHHLQKLDINHQKILKRYHIKFQCSLCQMHLHWRI